MISFICYLDYLILTKDSKRHHISFHDQFHQKIRSKLPAPRFQKINTSRAKLLSCVRLFATLWTVAHQVPLSVEFSRQEYWNGLPFPPPEDLPDPGTEPVSHTPPALAGGFFTIGATWEAPNISHNGKLIAFIVILILETIKVIK